MVNIWQKNLKVQYIFSVDGNWGSWSSFGKCSKSCGSGTQLRRRSCDKPPISNGGTPCDGSSIEIRVCSTRPCPGIRYSWHSLYQDVLAIKSFILQLMIWTIVICSQN